MNELLDKGDIVMKSRKASTYMVTDNELLRNTIIQIVREMLAQVPGQFGNYGTIVHKYNWTD